MPYRQNKRTGKWWEVDANGNPIRPVQAQQAPQGHVLTVPQSPEKARQERRQAQIDAINQANDAERIRLDQERAAREEAKFKADLAEKGMMQTPDGQIVPIPGWKPRKTAAEQADQDARINALNSLVQQINRVQELGNSGPLASDGMISAIGDYLPTSSNKRFDTAGAQLSQQGLAAFRVPGTGTVSDRDAIMFDRGNLPQASNFDSANQEILDGLRRRTEEEYRSRGLPLPKWVLPNGRQVANVWDQAQIMAPVEAAAPFGATERQVPIPAEMQAEYQQYMANNFGNINPDDYANFRAGLDAKYGFGPQSPDLYKADAAKFNEYYNAGGRQVAPLPGPTEKLSLSQYISNSLENNPVTASLANAGDAASLGTISLLDRKFGDGNMQRLSEANPNAALVGQVAGSIVGGGALNRLGSAAAGRFLPALLQGGKGAAAARGIAGDVAYSTIYGTNTGGSPIESALLGGVGGALGRGVGGVAGAAAGGVARSPAAQKLASLGVPMTVGQNLGGFAKAVEDRLMSVPWVGDAVGKRRMESFQGFNRAALNEAGAPISATVNDTGERGLQQLLDQIGTAYDNATAGARVPLDPQFSQDMMAARALGDTLPPDLSQKFATAVNNRAMPVAVAGELTGDTYQQAMRGFKGYKAETVKPGFEADYRDALSGVQDAFKGQMMRGGGADVVDKLGKADQAYRMAKVLEDAQGRAINGTGSGATNIFTPAQLNLAARANAKKFGGQRPFAQLAEAGQEVLPSKIPDSGTAGRMLQLMLPSAVAGGAGGYALGDSPTGVVSTLALMALLRGGASKAGQKAMSKALFDRPDSLKALGTAINKRKGLFGAASIPLMLEAQN